MLKKIVFLLAFLTLAVSVYAADNVKTPINQRGDSVMSMDFAGCDYYRIDATSACVMITSPTYTSRASGSVVADSALKTGNACPIKVECIVYGVAFSSLTPNLTSTYLVLRDSTTPSFDMTHAITPEIMAGDLENTTYVTGKFVRFPIPIRCKNGLSAGLHNGTVKPAGSVVIYYKMRESDGY